MNYVCKRKTIDAWYYDPNDEKRAPFPFWLQKALTKGEITVDQDGDFKLHNSNDDYCCKTWWLVLSETGDISVMSSSDLEDNYEPINS